jgi:hypothetical protein
MKPERNSAIFATVKIRSGRADQDGADAHPAAMIPAALRAQEQPV